jgi:Sulfatase
LKENLTVIEEARAMSAQAKKSNIVLIVSDDTGYGDLAAYDGGEGRGIPTPSFDRLADEGMTFSHNYGQPSCGAAVYGSIVSNDAAYTSYQVQPSSPGARLLESYQLTQTPGPPNLVVVYDLNNSVICARPNNLVAAGN